MTGACEDKNMSRCECCCPYPYEAMLDQPYYTQWMFYVPILSMIAVILEENVLSMVALAFSSFPQYIIALSFILEHQILDTFNVMAIIMSLIQLLTSPFITPSVYVLKEEMNRGDSDVKKVAVPGLLAFVAYIVILLPVILLEIVHFCPILFEYYYYDGIDYDQLVTQLLYFNLPKLLFLFVPLVLAGCGTCFLCCCVLSKDAAKKWSKDVQNGMNIIENYEGYAKMVALFIGYCICFLVLPLIPIVIFMAGVTGDVASKEMDEFERHMNQQHNTNKVNNRRIEKVFQKDGQQYLIQHSEKEEERFRDMYDRYSEICTLRIVWITLLVYIVLAYGSMGTMLWTVDDGVGEITYAMLLTTWALSVYMLLMPLLLPIFFVIGITLGMLCCKLEIEWEKFVFGARHLMINLFCNCCFPCANWKQAKVLMGERGIL